MKRAVTYSRVSAFDKHGDSIESQVEMCREYATGNGYAVVTELHDRNVSGADMSAPALERALLMAERGEFDVLVTRELDRFARRLAKQLIMEGEFKRYGVAIEYVIGDHDDTPEGVLTKNVRAVIAEYEREKIAERMTRGRYRSARRGNVFVTNTPPYGYRIVSDDDNGRPRRTLAVVEEEAEIVRQIFHWYVYDLMSLRAIAAKLTEMKVPTPGDQGKSARRKTSPFGLWRNEFVRKIVMRRAYTGEWVYDTQQGEILVEIEPILDHALYAKAQRRRSLAKAASPRNVKHDYLIRGRVFCASCGYRIHALTRRFGQRIYHYYRCPGSASKELTHQCNANMYRADATDAAVWGWLSDAISDPLALGYRPDDDDEAQHVRDRIASANQRILDNRTKIARLSELFEVGRHTREIVIGRQRRLEQAIKRIEDERDELLTQLDDAVARQSHAQDVQRLAVELRDGLDEAGDRFEAQRNIIEWLDVSARLEQKSKKEKLAHIDIGGRHYATVAITTHN